MTEEAPGAEGEMVDFGQLYKLLDKENGYLLDANHQATQEARRAVQRIRKIQDRFNEHVEEIVDLYVVRAVAFSQIAESLIMAEFDGEEVEENVEEGEDEGE